MEYGLPGIKFGGEKRNGVEVGLGKKGEGDLLAPYDAQEIK